MALSHISESSIEPNGGYGSPGQYIQSPGTLRRPPGASHTDSFRYSANTAQGGRSSFYDDGSPSIIATGADSRLARVQEWHDNVPLGVAPTISEQPIMSPTMSVSGIDPLDGTTETSFPLRGPNLDRLDKVHYRLLSTTIGPIPSYRPFQADDNSISFVHLQHIPPPRTAEKLKTYICSREKIHKSRVKLYKTSEVDSMKQELVSPEETIRNQFFTADNAIIMSVELGPDGDRKTAATPLDLHVIAARTVVEGTKKGLDSSCSTLMGCTPGCLSATAACPMACLTGFFRSFRVCWTETWSCGNPALYQPQNGDLLLLCCWWTC
ncbi:hypothetical protein SISSUDRAFT_1056935 [Sistotremastrum suecicum HHB10207 ss-3]|uniref:Uncharacterized protein n=1 Tax=Sistotremastrum suecicum HHB10207 ss-3 TaxID=1314776 RepID=A0A166JCZ4_9AGAM|nr:hypothetical protein SISSUDRAFT_1056935 [Sistotremastrum suecicum HHB10207 ss-3]